MLLQIRSSQIHCYLLVTGYLVAQESSLRSFCEAPENRRIIEREQKQQLLRSARHKQQQESVQFRQKVLLTFKLAFGLHFAIEQD